MKRITYISRLANALSVDDIETIGKVSGHNNRLHGITGLLVYFDRLFFQIIEGPDEKVDHLFDKIGQDPRHQDILRLKTEYEVTERLFPVWTMKTFNLDHDLDELARPIKILLQAVTESHAVIEHYTQPSVLKIVNQGMNPLVVAPALVDKIVLFIDIVSYSTLSERLDFKEMLLILNTYFEICSRIILNVGGEVNKFLGDGLMAYFDVEQADDAIQVCLDIMQELQDLRGQAPPSSPLRLLHAGFGLDQGPVIEGNMGSRYKMDFTIIGDTVNTASRLEGLTRELDCSLILSESVKNSTQQLWAFVDLGKYHLKGKEMSAVIYSIAHPLLNAGTFLHSP